MFVYNIVHLSSFSLFTDQRDYHTRHLVFYWFARTRRANSQVKVHRDNVKVTSTSDKMCALCDICELAFLLGNCNLVWLIWHEKLLTIERSQMLLLNCKYWHLCVFRTIQSYPQRSVPLSGRGRPNECWQRTNSAPSPSFSRTGLPMRVIIPMLATTYGESVTWTPNLAREEFTGPMLNGITYIVRPRARQGMWKRYQRYGNLHWLSLMVLFSNTGISFLRCLVLKQYINKNKMAAIWRIPQGV